MYFLLQPVFAASVMQYMWSLWQLQMTDEEVGAFTGLLLVSPTRLGLSATTSVTALHRALGDALRVAVTQTTANQPLAEARLDALVVLAGEARSLGALHPQALLWCRTNWPRLTLPALFSEIFDITNSNEEVNEAAALPELPEPPTAPYDAYDPTA